ncbi:OB-fold putative lipoprotein [Pendulispora rubella]|uniref:OB-fold putative lipoprotein n=1 Tax=Pendulispora rubella TaxID=2741070 RepID=A0ABZ2LA51_9BACT
MNQHQGGPSGGYGPPPPQGYPQQGYPQMQPPKKGMSGLMIGLLIFGGCIVFGMGSCLVCVGVGAKRAARTATSAPEPNAGAGRGAVAAATPTSPPAAATSVEIATLLGDYKGNEVRADGLYKGKSIRTTGKVVDIKKDVLGSMYVTVGTGKAFEIPKVQCMLNAENLAKASSLNQGQTVTVEGNVSGLMMNVLIRDCDIN